MYDWNNLEPYKHDEEMNNYCTPENKIKINQLIGKYFFSSNCNFLPENIHDGNLEN